RQKIQQYLTFAGYDGPFPRAFQFLAIDVPADEDTSFELREIPGVRYVGLAQTYATYRGENGADSMLMGLGDASREFERWRPNPDGVDVSLIRGAGQQRAVGRVVTSVFNARIEPAIRQAIDDCTGHPDELVACAQKLGYDVFGTDDLKMPLVILVSSLGGGAGSGMFLDVADMLRMSARASDTWLRESLCGVLYDPSVFEIDGVDADGGIAPNALAAIGELVAGQWKPWAPSRLLTNFTGDLGNYAGLEYSFLIGSSNGVVDFDGPLAVYDATATALAAWVTNAEFANQTDSFTIGNWSQTPIEARLPLHGGPSARLPLSSFGFSRLSLGTSLFGGYAAERLTRSAVDALLQDPRGADEGDRSTPAQQAVRRVAENGYNLVYDFLNDCKLNEDSPDGRGSGADQVLEAVGDFAALDVECSLAVQSMISNVKDVRNMMAQFEGRESYDLKPVPAKMRGLHEQRAVEWAREIQPAVIDAVVGLAAVEGLPVAVEVLAQVEERLGVRFPGQLREEAAKMQRENPWLNRRQLIPEVKTKGATVPPPVRRAMEDIATKRVKTDVAADLRNICAGLLEDMARNFIAPLKLALRDADAVLRQERVSPRYRVLADVSVPTRLRPAKTEVSLTDPSEFAGLYEHLLTETVGSTANAVRDVTCGRFGAQRSQESAPVEFQPFRLEQRWVPELEEHSPERSVAQAARVDLRLSVGAIEDRADHWLAADTGTAIGKFVRMSIRDWVNDQSLDTAKRNARGKLLATQLSRAFDLAQPLVELNEAWRDRTHQAVGVSPFEFRLNKISLSETDPGYEDVVRVLKTKLDKSDVSSNLSTGLVKGSDDRTIEIFSILRPLTPSCFESLVHPIVSNWQSTTANAMNGESNFWRHRRARPLLDAVPLRRDVLETLARGWSTARIIGRLDIGDRTKEVTIHTPTGPRRFLHPSLSGPSGDDRNLFGRILESALLAEFVAATGRSEHLEALEELLRLGNSQGIEMVDLDYTSMNPELAAYLDDQTDPVEHAQQLADDLDENADSLEADARHQAPRSGWGPAEMWRDTASLQVAALRRLATVIRAHRSPASSAASPKRTFI
ncbi:MAG: tubulin-like doman-containing protein, partial [Ilumatobacteraceae bacterium]